MRMKKDYLGNDQLLPGYNIQFGVCDEYIAVFDVKQYAAGIHKSTKNRDKSVEFRNCNDFLWFLSS